jgi:hypothetical protein
MEDSVKKRLILLVSGFLVVGLTFGMSYMQKASATVPGTNYLASQDSSGTYANSRSDTPYTSGDGRYIAFDSLASNLTLADTNGYMDVFVKDTATGTITRASTMTSGTQYSTFSLVRGISYDGRYVLFSVGTGSYSYLVVRDLTSNTSTNVCQTTHGCTTYGMQGGSISADGRYVTYANLDYPGHKYQVMVTNMQTWVSKTLSVDTSGVIGNDDSSAGGMSCDGGIITFSSAATNLPGGSGSYLVTIDLNGSLNLTKIPISSDSQVSCNGNIILYTSSGSVYEYNRLNGQTTTIGSGVGASMNGDGRYVAFTTNTAPTTTPTYPSTGAGAYNDVYMYDTKTSTRQLITFTIVSNRSGEVNGSSVALSADGSKVAYAYYTPSSTDTTHELISGVTTGTTSTQSDIYTSLTGY